jgi:hypothetical protein
MASRSSHVTRIALTVDTEFSIAGAFRPPYDRTPVTAPFVWCEVDGRSEGLGFILATLGAQRQSATFFVEALHRDSQPADPMRRAVDEIAAAGHDIQLHLHPAWCVFEHSDWPARVSANPRQDDFFGRSHDEVCALIERGQRSFSAWGVPEARVLRTGSLQHDHGVYAACRSMGLLGASNIGVGIWRHPDPRYHLYSGQHALGGVWEAPITSYIDLRVAGRTHLKSLTIQGSSSGELEHLLWQAHARRMPHLVILTHPFEYVIGYDERMHMARRHRRNQAKLRRLCEFIAANSAHFAMTQLTMAMADAAATPRSDNHLLSVPLHRSLPRLFGNSAYEWLAG